MEDRGQQLRPADRTDGVACDESVPRDDGFGCSDEEGHVPACVTAGGNDLGTVGASTGDAHCGNSRRIADVIGVTMRQENCARIFHSQPQEIDA
jgi:hypothetical protein